MLISSVIYDGEFFHAVKLRLLLFIGFSALVLNLVSRFCCTAFISFSIANQIIYSCLDTFVRIIGANPVKSVTPIFVFKGLLFNLF